MTESASRAETPAAASAEGSEDRLPPVVEPVRPPAPLAVRPRRVPIAVVTAGLVAAASLAVVAGAIMWRAGGLGNRDSPVPPGRANAKPSEGTRDADSPVPVVSVVPSAVGEGDLERRAALRVLQAGGSLELHVGEEKRSVAAQENLPLERFQIAQIALGDRPVSDQNLNGLQGLARVEELALWNTAVSDAGLKHLDGLTTLRALYLTGTAVQGPGLERLTGLKRLELNGTPIDDAGLRHVAPLRQLECLYLEGTQVSDAGLETLRSLTNLKELHLEQTQVTPEGVTRLRIRHRYQLRPTSVPRPSGPTKNGRDQQQHRPDARGLPQRVHLLPSFGKEHLGAKHGQARTQAVSSLASNAEANISSSRANSCRRCRLAAFTASLRDGQIAAPTSSGSRRVPSSDADSGDVLANTASMTAVGAMAKPTVPVATAATGAEPVGRSAAWAATTWPASADGGRDRPFKNGKASE